MIKDCIVFLKQNTNKSNVERTAKIHSSTCVVLFYQGRFDIFFSKFKIFCMYKDFIVFPVKLIEYIISLKGIKIGLILST